MTTPDTSSTAVDPQTPADTPLDVGAGVDAQTGAVDGEVAAAVLSSDPADAAPTTPLGEADLHRLFDFPLPDSITDEGARIASMLRAKVREVAREVEEAVMWLNAAVARNGVHPDILSTGPAGITTRGRDAR